MRFAPAAAGLRCWLCSPAPGFETAAHGEPAPAPIPTGEIPARLAETATLLRRLRNGIVSLGTRLAAVGFESGEKLRLVAGMCGSALAEGRVKNERRSHVQVAGEVDNCR